MSGFPILDLVVGLVFIYFLLSIICSSAVELWLSIRKSRAVLLASWLRRIFDAQALDSRGEPVVDSKGKPVSVGQEIMDHCMVTALSKVGESNSYIDAKNFVTALLDKITILPFSKNDTTGTGPKLASDNVQLPPENLPAYIEAIKKTNAISGELKRTILTFANEATQAAAVIKNIPEASGFANNITTGIKSELDHFRERLENWYDTNSNRLTGTLKRKKAQPKTIIIAVIITIALNVDSVEVCKYLYDNKEMSKQLADKALSTYQSIYDSTSKRTDVTSQDLNKKVVQLKQDIGNLQSFGLPLGWKKNETFLAGLKAHWIGWLATILAICLGAPFWFDILNKIGNLRNSGPKPVVSDDTSKK